MDAFTKYDARWQKDLYVVFTEKRKEGGTVRQQEWRRKKDRWKVEIQSQGGGKMQRGTGLDRHALKKITVSSGILKEKEHTGEQIRKDTCGSQRNSARKSIDSWMQRITWLFESHDFLLNSLIFETCVRKRKSDQIISKLKKKNLFLCLKD